MTHSYAKLTDLHAGDIIEIDEGFSCRKAGLARVQDTGGKLYFFCDEGKHFLDGQCDDGVHCIGVFKHWSWGKAKTKAGSHP